MLKFCVAFFGTSAFAETRKLRGQRQLEEESLWPVVRMLAEEKHFKDIFSEVDQNHDRTVTFIEFETLMRERGLDAAQEFNNPVFGAINNGIQEAAFIDYLTQIEPMFNYYKVLDRNADGIIIDGELRQGMDDLGVSVTSDAEVTKMISTADLNKEYGIDKHEFVNMVCGDLFSEFDKNHDGTVMLEEFKTLMWRRGLNAAPEFKKADKDRSGGIQKAEFCAYLPEMDKMTKTPSFRNFKALAGNANVDGKIGIDDVKQWMNKASANLVTVIGWMIKAGDFDNDQAIDYDEYVKMDYDKDVKKAHGN